MSIVLKNKNFAVSKLLSGITAAATSLTVLAGEGSKFPTSGQFRAVIWSQSYESPIQDGTREIVTMQLSAGDVFDITRAQESTSAKAWNASDNVAHVITAGKIDELETEINAKKTDNVSATNKVLGRVSAGAGAIEEIPCTAAGRTLIAKAAYPAFSVHKNGTSQSIPNQVWTKLTWSTEEWDNNNNFASDKFTPTVAGKYHLMAAAQIIDLPQYSSLLITVYKNGIAYKIGMKIPVASTDSVTALLAVDVDANGSSDYFEIYLYQSHTGALNCSGAASLTYFQGHFVPTGS